MSKLPGNTQIVYAILLQYYLESELNSYSRLYGLRR